MKLAEEIAMYLLIALICYLVRLDLCATGVKERHNVVEELDQKVGSNARKGWKLRRMPSGLSSGLETSSNHMFGSPSQISCMTLAKSSSALASSNSNGAHKPC